jgi:hypothetical protein
MSQQKKVIMLTKVSFKENVIGVFREKILIGTESIIDAEKKVIKSSYSQMTFNCTEICSRAAMVTSNYVEETPEEIYKIINS